MANDLTGNPLIIDTTTGAAITGEVRIQAIVWAHNEDHPIAADNDLTITNTAGRVIFQMRQPTAGESAQLILGGSIRTDGVKVTVLDGGEVFIYLT
ncbi:hypothetical protein DRO54_10780, partial [Candidatus Bathyarchaeota archaeon]